MITVFTPCYNQGEYLSKSIESVLAQTHDDFEYIIYNDGSIDDTAKVAKMYADSDNRVRFINGDKNLGVAHALNVGISQMVGDVFVWVPADDVVKSDLLSEKLKYHDNKTVLYSWFEHIDNHDKAIDTIEIKDVKSDSFYEESYKQCFIGFTGIWIPKIVFNVVGGFPEDLNFSEDYYWMLKASKIGVRFDCVKKVLYSKRLHGNRLTSRNGSAISQRVCEIRKRIDAI